MSEIRITPQTVLFIDTTDLETFIKEETGRAYTITYVWIRTSITISSRQARMCEDQWEAFKKGLPKPISLQVILNGLYSDGKLPEGTYIIDDLP